MRTTLGPLVTVLICCLGATTEPTSAYGPATHTLMAYKDRGSTLGALKRWGVDTTQLNPDQKRRIIAASMAGALLHDVGYVNKDLRDFSDLLHYQGTGRFVDGFLSHVVQRQEKPEVIAFALGALQHYTGDREGHYWATNRASAYLLQLTGQVGSRLHYEDNEACHACIEAGFDHLVSAGLSSQEFEDLTATLDILASMVLESELFFYTVPQTLVAVLVLEYGFQRNVFADMEWLKWWTTRVIPAYRELLGRMDLALREARTLYGVAFDSDRLPFWKKAISTGVKVLMQPCGTLGDRIEKYAVIGHWFAGSVEKASQLYALYVDRFQKLPLPLSDDLFSMWKAGMRPADINLDTNLLAAGSEYHLADQSFDFLQKNSEKAKLGQIAFVKKFQKLGIDRQRAYFESANVGSPLELSEQIKYLDGLERRSNRLTAPGRSIEDLPTVLPSFQVIGEGECIKPSGIRQTIAPGRYIYVSKETACLPLGATVFEAWLAAVVAGRRAEYFSTNRAVPLEGFVELQDFVEETAYAYMKKHQASGRAYKDRCLEEVQN